MLYIDEAQSGTLQLDELETPIGTLHLAAVGDALCAVGFASQSLSPALRRRFGDVTRRRAPLMAAAHLRDYFAGDLGALDRIAVDPAGTPFQRSVWALLRAIPAGETRTYGQLAKQLGSSPRAVGSANGSNPVGIVIPCHRVIGTGGALTGYAWGVDRKRWLLDHERP